MPPSLKATAGSALSDGRLALSELRGTAVVLNFWASWCAPCRTEARVLEDGWQEAGQRGVLFLGLNMQDVTEDARDFVREFGLTFPHVREGGKETARRYGATGLPETFFISARGRVVGHVIGAMEPGQLRAGISAAERDRPIAAGEGGARQTTR